MNPDDNSDFEGESARITVHDDIVVLHRAAFADR